MRTTPYWRAIAAAMLILMGVIWFIHFSSRAGAAPCSTGPASGNAPRQRTQYAKDRSGQALACAPLKKNGEGGIRTRERDEPVTGFQDRRLQPLGHLTGWGGV